MKTAVILILLLAAVMAYVRFTPVTAESGPGRPNLEAVGDHAMRGGHYAVRSSDEVPLDKLIAVIEATPRTIKLGDGIYVTRSLIWGFPDITHVWSENENTHVSSHLVYGSSDLGVNRKRMEKWLAELD
ncbi:MAG: DUF1499 domain-containing protein [Pseudomonadota bacterium]